MTSERKAELRRLAKAATPGQWQDYDGHPGAGNRGHGFIRSEPAPAIGEYLADVTSRKDAAYIVAAANAIPELLDELEADTKHIEYLRNDRDGLGELLHQRTLERNSLAAQVVRLRGTLEITHLDAPGKCPDTKCPVVKILADTEAAATTWLEADRREQRRLGARELYERYRANSTGEPYLLEGLLAEMEREES